MNLIVIFITCTCIVMHSLFCQLPNYNLFTQHVIYLYGESPLVNCGPRSILLHLYYHLLQTLLTFHKYYFISLQANISLHTIRLILCFQQTGEIDNLTASWGKVVWLCCVQVPRCCWCRHRAINCLLVPTSNNLQKWFLSPTGRLKFGFILRENLLLCSSYCCLRRCWCKSLSSWEPQEEGMMSIAANFPSVRNQGLSVQEKAKLQKVMLASLVTSNKGAVYDTC
jgi:hypothetical protein